MTIMIKRLTSLALCLASLSVWADDIVIGQCAPMSGSLAKTGQALAAGVKLAVDAANAKGGVNGQKIRLIQKDDGYDANLTVSCTKDLIEKDKAVALIGYAGTGNVGKLLEKKVLEEAGIALVAPFTGGPALRDPYNPWIFHIRASYTDEINTMVEQFVKTGMNKVAVFYQNDAFGQSGLKAVETALGKHSLKIVSSGSYEKNTEEINQGLEKVLKGGPQAIIVTGITRPAALFIKQVQARTPGVQVFALSITDAEQLHQVAGDASRGVGITQVMPAPATSPYKISQEYLETLKKYSPTVPPTYAHFEEYIGGRILINALQKAGKNPSAASVLKALESTQADIGGFKVAFGPNKRVGSEFVEITLIGPGGRFMR